MHHKPKGTILQRRDRERIQGRSQVETESETRVMPPQATEHLEPPELDEAKEDSHLASL